MSNEKASTLTQLTAKIADYTSGPALMLVSPGGRARIVLQDFGRGLDGPEFRHVLEVLRDRINEKPFEVEIPPMAV